MKAESRNVKTSHTQTAADFHPRISFGLPSDFGLHLRFGLFPRLGCLLGDMAKSAEILIALLQTVGSRQLQEVIEMFEKYISQGRRRLFAIGVRAAQWLRHNFIHQSKLK